MKNIIWSNINIDLGDWKEFLVQEHPDIEDEYKQLSLVEEENARYLEDERENLKIELQGKILVIGDLGRWDGRRQGYKFLGTSVSDILYGICGDYQEWYSDGYNIKGIEHHHDGVNYYEYCEIREGRNIGNLLDAIYRGDKISRQMLNYYTKSIHPYVAKCMAGRRIGSFLHSRKKITGVQKK